ncbi:hypothetical protein AB434_1618 [Heyndrickxia coagulans]|uniref:Uncharacterized protein n=1 Tax=Heyndrickxia coagulans TaxID=1398 RepID=A0AAN0TA27_HEYCO|nr:hypothetical protein SB48_HM08orf05924 [Heyndrickxia coagulans]AKN54023.1 hypothetical protein AB434_1618 [Heyndrickxia coagulans]
MACSTPPLPSISLFWEAVFSYAAKHLGERVNTGFFSFRSFYEKSRENHRPACKDRNET